MHGINLTRIGSNKAFSGHLGKVYYCPQVIIDGVVFHSFPHACKTCGVTVIQRGWTNKCSCDIKHNNENMIVVITTVQIITAYADN